MFTGILRIIAPRRAANRNRLIRSQVLKLSTAYHSVHCVHRLHKSNKKLSIVSIVSTGVAHETQKINLERRLKFSEK